MRAITVGKQGLRSSVAVESSSEQLVRDKETLERAPEHEVTWLRVLFIVAAPAQASQKTLTARTAHRIHKNPHQNDDHDGKHSDLAMDVDEVRPISALVLLNSHAVMGSFPISQ